MPYEEFPILDIKTAYEGRSSDKDNTYIMMAHIMRGVFDRDGYVNLSDRGKYCDATKATLEFAESIKSDVGICRPIESVIVNSGKNRWAKKSAISSNCLNVYNLSKTNVKDITDKIKPQSADKSVPAENEGDAGSPQSAGGNMVMKCSYVKPQYDTSIIYQLSLPKYLRNNRRVMNVNNMLTMLKPKINSKKNYRIIYNGRIRSRKNPSRVLFKHFKQN